MEGFCPLASGSKGNCLYFGTKKIKLLIDAGISCKAIEMRLAELGVRLSEIDAVLISHEHGDHIRGLDRLVKAFNIPIFANSETAKAICEGIKTRPRFKIFSTGETFEFGDVAIHPFSVQHDTLDPVAFTLQVGGIKIGVCSDLGFVTTLVTFHLQQCDYLYIEANHEPAKVYACSRSFTYKQRVLGNQGHLSNDSCAALVKEVLHGGLKHIYLAHLSLECNHPALALKKVSQQITGDTTVSIAYQDKISDCVSFG